MFDIYKINHVINNKIKKIFVFTGPYKIKQESSGPKINKTYKIFTKSEWTLIQKEKISVEYQKFNQKAMIFFAI